MEVADSHNNISFPKESWIPRVVTRSTTWYRVTLPTTLVPNRKAATDETTITPTIPVPISLNGSAKATPTQGAIIALGIICGLLIFGILLFMILYRHYNKKKVTQGPIPRPPFLPLQGHFPQPRQPNQHLYETTTRPQTGNGSGRNLEGQHRDVPGIPQGMNAQSAPINIPNPVFAHPRRRNGVQGENHMEREGGARASQRPLSSSPTSIYTPTQPEDIDIDARTTPPIPQQPARSFSNHPNHRSQMMGEGEMDPDVARALREQGIDPTDAMRRLVQQNIQHLESQGLYPSAPGTEGMPNWTQPYYQDEDYTMQRPVPEPVQAQRRGGVAYTVDDIPSDVEGRRISIERDLPTLSLPGSRSSRRSVSGELGGGSNRLFR